MIVTTETLAAWIAANTSTSPASAAVYLAAHAERHHREMCVLINAAYERGRSDALDEVTCLDIRAELREIETSERQA